MGEKPLKGEEKPLKGRDTLSFGPSSAGHQDGAQDYLIFMITGNPGLISFYEPFLSTLSTLLSTSSSSSLSSACFHIRGNSLAGFNSGKDDNEKSSEFPFSLEDQILHTENLLFTELSEFRDSKDSGDISPKVILMGHSVGAYILLELIRRHREKIHEGEVDFDLIGGILLFPTITHLAESPQGMMYSVSWAPSLVFPRECLEVLGVPMYPLRDDRKFFKSLILRTWLALSLASCFTCYRRLLCKIL